MKQPVYKREYNKSSLIFEQEKESQNALFQIRMLLENKIEGLLSCEVHPFNGESHIYYDITGKQTISCIFEKRKMSAADVESILLGIKNTLFNMQNYLLDADHLLLLPEYIYMDLSTKQIFFCFYPFETGDQEEKFSRLAEYLLEKIDHEEQQAVFAAYQFYRLIREKNSSFFQVVDQLYQYREENP